MLQVATCSGTQIDIVRNDKEEDSSDDTHYDSEDYVTSSFGAGNL